MHAYMEDGAAATACANGNKPLPFLVEGWRGQFYKQSENSHKYTHTTPAQLDIACAASSVTVVVAVNFNFFQILHQEFSSSANCLSLVETLSTICYQNPHYSYCPSSEYGEQAPTANKFVELHSSRNTSINVPGLGAIDVNTGSSDFAKFLPAGRTTDTDNSQASQINSDGTSGLGRTRHGLLSLAGLGTFDIRKQVGNGAGFSNLFSELFHQLFLYLTKSNLLLIR
uniref:Uncharacterized protein n=1 Tax=Ditylenchus dipsaci TaxID=166011 RepID=A0A915CNV3_9BILA